MITAEKALPDRDNKPTEAVVRDALGGNLCRCGAYQPHPPAAIETREDAPLGKEAYGR